MRDEGTCRSATVDNLEHRSLELNIITAEEVLTNGTVHRSADTDHIARSRTGDQVELAATDSLIFRKSNFFTLRGRPCLWQRTQGLRGNCPRGVRSGKRSRGRVVSSLGLGSDLSRGGEDRQLTALRGNHATVNIKEVTQVNVIFVLSQRLCTNRGGREHHLDLVARTIHEGCKAELSTVTRQNNAARESNDVIGLFASFQMAVLFTDLCNGRGDRKLHRVGGNPRLHEACTLGSADLYLFRGIVNRRISHDFNGSESQRLVTPMGMSGLKFTHPNSSSPSFGRGAKTQGPVPEHSPLR